MRVGGGLLLVLCLAGQMARAEVCASSFSELDKTPLLSSLKPLFSEDKRIAMVNETKGSYVIIDSLDDKLTISFFTSGIFDLYPVRKDGPLQFCDDGDSLKMIGLGRSEEFRVTGDRFQMGSGGAKKSFSYGEMPELLKRLHRVDARGVASKR